MKNLKNILLLILLTGIFEGCSLMSDSNTYVQIYDCIHGRVEVEVREKTFQYTEFCLYVYPDKGYTFDSDNLYIMSHNEKGRYNDYYYSDDNRIIPIGTNNKKIFYFKADTGAKISITAFFTKLEQE